MLPRAGVGSIKPWLCLIALQGGDASTCTFPLGVPVTVVGAGPQAPGGAFTQEIPLPGGPVVNRHPWELKQC